MNIENWNYLSINECADVIGGGTPATKNPDYWDGNIPWISPKDLSNNQDKYITKGERSITELGLEKSSAKLLPANSLLFSSRAPIGYLAINTKPVATNQGFKSLILKEEFDVEFFYYLFKDKTKHIKNFASGSTFQEVSGSVVKNLSFLIPPKQEQKRISNILSKLDKKIELNQKMNETLEEIAKTLFKSWFIDFDPVRAKAEGRPTGLSKEISDLFPDSFEDSELGRIPKEWDIISISELVTKNTKSINTSNSEDFFEHFSIPAFDDEQQPVLDQGIHIKSNKTIIESGSLLVSKLNPDNPRIWIPKIKEEYQQICSTEFMVFTPSELTNLSFIWGLFTSSKILGLMCSMVTGTSKSHQRVRPNDVLKITSIKPNQKLIHSYGILVEPILQKIMSNKTESKILSKIRDLLLPKLISGELEIPDAENIIKEAGI